VQRRELRRSITSIKPRLRKKAQLHRRHPQRNKAVTAVLNRARAVKARALCFLEGSAARSNGNDRKRVSKLRKTSRVGSSIRQWRDKAGTFDVTLRLDHASGGSTLASVRPGWRTQEQRSLHSALDFARSTEFSMVHLRLNL